MSIKNIMAFPTAPSNPFNKPKPAPAPVSQPKPIAKPTSTFIGKPTPSSPTGTYLTPTGGVSHQSTSPFNSGSSGGGGHSAPPPTTSQPVPISQQKTSSQTPIATTTSSISALKPAPTLGSVWVGSGLPVTEKLKQTWDIVTFNKGNNYSDSQQEADYLRRGRQTQFQGKNFIQLNPVEKRGTSTITSVPFESGDMVKMIDFTGGAGIVLGERQQRAMDILGTTTAQNIEMELRPQFQAKVTAGTSELELNKINADFNKQFQTEFTSRTKAPSEAIKKEYSGYYSTLENTQIGKSVIKTLPLVALGGFFGGGATAGIVLGGATIASTITTPSSYKWVYEAPKIEGGVGSISQQYTKIGTFNLAMGGLMVGLGSYGKIRGIESDMFKAEISRLTNQNKIVQPYWEQRYTSPNVDVSFTKAKVGSMDIGKAQTDIFSSTVTIKKGTSFTYGQKSVAITRAELSWNYPQGNKFLSIQVSGTSGKGMMLPTDIAGKGFSVYQVTPKYNVGTSALFKDFRGLNKGLTSNVRSLPIQNTKFYLGQSTQLKDGFYLGKSMELKGLALDTRSGKLNWAALTGETISRGFTKIMKPKDVGNKGGFTTTLPKGSPKNPSLESLSPVIQKQIPIVTPEFASGTGYSFMKVEKIMPNMDLRTTNAIIPKLSGLQEKRTTTQIMQQSVSPVSLIKNDMLVGSVYKIATTQGMASAQALNLKQQQLTIPKVTTTSINQQIPTMNLPPLQPFSVPFVLPNIKMDFDFSQRSRKYGTKTKRKYTPSYDALIRGIRGKAPKSAGKIALGTRPITRGFKWSF